MGGDDSQKLLPWRGIYSSPGRSKPPAQRNQHSNLNPEVPVDRTNWALYGVQLRFGGLEPGLLRNYAARLEDASDEPIEMVEIAVSGLT